MDELMENINNQVPEMTVSCEALNAECLRRRYARLLEKPEVFPSEANWKFIIENRMGGIGHLLMRKYLVSWLMPDDKRSVYNTLALRYFPEYLAAVDRSYALRLVYEDIESAPEAFTKLVRELKLFDARELRRMIEERGAVELALTVLDVDQPYYTAGDARAMRALLGVLRSLPKLGRVEERHGLFSHEMRYYCPAGHSNPTGEAFCTHSGCGLNIYGLTREQADAIDIFAEKLDALDSLLRKTTPQALD